MIQRQLKNALWPVFALVLLAFSSGGAAAQDTVNISAFFGQWSGTGVSESNVSLYFRLTSRDLDVTIGPDGDGFMVDWTTVQRQRGDPDNPTPERKSNALLFVPTDRPNVWRATGSSDPLLDERYAWARLAGQTLTVHTLVINESGGYDMQVYTRTLGALGMNLEFVAFRDGEERRTAKGRLIKIAE